MKHGSLFSGIGGFDLAAEWMGWENLFHCEWNPFGQKVLKHYWPNAKSFIDITKSSFTEYANRIDVLSGGFPCQPYSSAGKRLGKEDERHKWPDMFRAVREIQPRYVVGENVRGLTNWNGGLVFDEVQADLESVGYQVLPFLLPACAVNAPHRRDRIWFVAHSRHSKPQRREEFEKGQQSNGGGNTRSEFASHGGLWVPSHSNGSGREGGENKEKGQHAVNGNTWDFFPTQSPIYNGDDGFPTGLDRTTVLKATGSQSDKGSHFHRWRTESIKAGGNAIVPQVALQIFKAIQQYEQLK